jgi:hypothetical protein
MVAVLRLRLQNILNDMFLVMQGPDNVSNLSYKFHKAGLVNV